jgi:hypothetical protein
MGLQQIRWHGTAETHVPLMAIGTELAVHLIDPLWSGRVDLPIQYPVAPNRYVTLQSGWRKYSQLLRPHTAVRH